MTDDKIDRLFEKGAQQALDNLYAKAAKEGIPLVTMDEDGNIVEKVPEIDDKNTTPSSPALAHRSPKGEGG